MLTTPPKQLGWLHPATIIATWFWSGLSPKAPGTVGTLAAIPFGLALTYFGGQIVTLLGAVVVFGIGVWAADKYAEASNKHDPGAVVVDEVAAMWLVMAAVPFSATGVIAAFVLFRFFDIFKPPPIKRLERLLPGGLGVMVDDIMAAAYAVLTYVLLAELTNYAWF